MSCVNIIKFNTNYASGGVGIDTKYWKIGIFQIYPA